MIGWIGLIIVFGTIGVNVGYEWVIANRMDRFGESIREEWKDVPSWEQDGSYQLQLY